MKKRNVMNVPPKRKLELRLSDSVCDEMLGLCGTYGMSVSRFLETFIRDVLMGATSMEPVTEEAYHAHQWLHSVSSARPGTLLAWLLSESITVESFISLMENISLGEKILKDYHANPSIYSQDKMEIWQSDVEDWTRDLTYYKKNYLQANPGADWNAEIELLKEWIQDKQLLMSRYVEELR